MVDEIREEARAEADTAEDAKADRAAEQGTPAVKPAVEKLSDGVLTGKFASNDGTFVLSGLDDGTDVAAGNVMESQARSPAHQQNELAVETGLFGFEEAAALMTPRGTRSLRAKTVEK